MKKRFLPVCIILICTMILPMFAVLSMADGYELAALPFVNEVYYLGGKINRIPVVDDQTVSDGEYRHISSLRSPVARYNVFSDEADAADGKGKYNSKFDKIAEDGRYTDAQLRLFSKEFDIYAAYDDEYIYIAFRDLGASGEDFYSYRSDYNLRFTLNSEDPTRHFVLTGKNLDSFKISNESSSGADGIKLSSDDFDKVVISSSMSKYKAGGGILKASNENNTTDEGAYELYYQAKISKKALLSYSNSYCGTDYAEFPGVMYLNVSAKHYTSQKDQFAEKSNYEAMWFGGVTENACDAWEWQWKYNAMVFGNEGNDDVLAPVQKLAPDHDTARAGNIYVAGGEPSAVKTDGDLSEGEYNYKTDAIGITQWFDGDGKYESISTAEESLSRLTDAAIKERTLSMLKSLNYTYYFAQDSESLYIAFEQTGGYASDPDGAGQWPCRIKTDIRIGFDPSDSSKYINVFYNKPSSVGGNASVIDDVTVLANFTSHPDKANGIRANGVLEAMSIKRYYTESLNGVTAGELVKEEGNVSINAPSTTVAELKISKAALLELMKQNGYAEDYELSNILWFDLFATVYWVASDSYGMTAGSPAYSSSVSFSGCELGTDAQEQRVSADIHIPDMVIFGDEKKIKGCSYTSRNEDERYLVEKPSCTAGGSYYVSCEHCGCAGVSVFYGENTLSHSYLYRVKEEKYLASVADCTHPAKYYYSCACGASSGSESDGLKRIFFSDGEALEHDFSFGAYVTDESYHWKRCRDCGTKGSYEEHIYDGDDDASCNVCNSVRDFEPVLPPESSTDEPASEVTENTKLPETEPPETTSAPTDSTTTEVSTDAPTDKVSEKVTTAEEETVRPPYTNDQITSAYDTYTETLADTESDRTSESTVGKSDNDTSSSTQKGTETSTGGSENNKKGCSQTVGSAFVAAVTSFAIGAISLLKKRREA